MNGQGAPEGERGSNEGSMLDTEEAARSIGCSPGYLAKLRQTGGGPTYHRLYVRKGVRYDLADLRDWMAGRRFGSTSEYPEASR